MECTNFCNPRLFLCFVAKRSRKYCQSNANRLITKTHPIRLIKSGDGLSHVYQDSDVVKMRDYRILDAFGPSPALASGPCTTLEYK
jgi:hypothetical protein